MFRATLCTLLTLVWILASAHAQETSATPRTQYFPDTTDGIHLEMVFNYNVAYPSSEESLVDMVWGSDYPNLPPHVYNTAYIPYSVDNFTNTIEWYQQNHPDWLEYLCDRKTLAFEFGTTTLAPLDFANPAVKAYQWANWVDAPLASGYKGIAVDTLSVSSNWGRCGHYGRDGSWVQQYTGQLNDPAYQRDETQWESDTYRHIHNYSKTATMQVNMPFEFGYSREVNLQLMLTSDLVLDERGFTNYGVDPNFPPPWQWEAIAKIIGEVQKKGVCYMTNGEESAPTGQISEQSRLWAIANYLLVKGNCTYMYMSGLQQYGSLVIFPEYSIPIGHPLGRMRRTQGVWGRTYSGGLALVNPYNETFTVNLPGGSFVDVNGVSADAIVTMAPHSGVVLLRAE